MLLIVLHNKKLLTFQFHKCTVCSSIMVDEGEDAEFATVKMEFREYVFQTAGSLWSTRE